MENQKVEILSRQKVKSPLNCYLPNMLYMICYFTYKIHFIRVHQIGRQSWQKQRISEEKKNHKTGFRDNFNKNGPNLTLWVKPL